MKNKNRKPTFIIVFIFIMIMFLINYLQKPIPAEKNLSEKTTILSEEDKIDNQKSLDEIRKSYQEESEKLAIKKVSHEATEGEFVPETKVVSTQKASEKKLETIVRIKNPVFLQSATPQSDSVITIAILDGQQAKFSKARKGNQNMFDYEIHKPHKSNSKAPWEK